MSIRRENQLEHITLGKLDWDTNSIIVFVTYTNLDVYRENRHASLRAFLLSKQPLITSHKEEQ